MRLSLIQSLTLKMAFCRSLLIATCGLYGVVVSQNTTSTTEPCAVVSAAYASQIAVSPSATPTVAASIAHDCLLSVPLGQEEALALIESIEPYLEWQSGTFRFGINVFIVRAWD